MLRCKKCNSEFENQNAAEDHVIDRHADICDMYLENYISDSQREAIEDLIEGEEE